MPEDITIRPASRADTEAICAIGRELARDGTAYFFAPETTDQELEEYWLSPKGQTFVALTGGEVAGVCLLRANYPGRASHVANASYAVAARHQGTGVGRAMAEHSLQEARRQGFRAMQFNFVVSTNAEAVELWKKLGFEIVGTLPRAFQHPSLGLVDAFVMYRDL